jgi:hypothetical protein
MELSSSNSFQLLFIEGNTSSCVRLPDRQHAPKEDLAKTYQN